MLVGVNVIYPALAAARVPTRQGSRVDRSDQAGFPEPHAAATKMTNQMEELMKRLMLAGLFAGAAAAACGPPKKQTPVEEIPKLTKLEDVMDNQATVMDPLFKKIGQTSSPTRIGRR